MSNLKYKHTAYTSAQWASLNPVIVENEIVIESDTKRTKIGNGISTYNELEYADANSVGNSLGPIKPTDAAPTPARNGNYTFSIGGAKPAWLTAEALVTEVKAGDGVAVVYTAPSSYSYTHVDVSNDFEQIRSQSTIKGPSSKLLDDELNLKLEKNEYYPNFKNIGAYNPTGHLLDDSGLRHTDLIIINKNEDITFTVYSTNQYVEGLSFFDKDGIHLNNAGISNNQTIIAEQTVLKADIPDLAIYMCGNIDLINIDIAGIKNGGLNEKLNYINKTINTSVVALTDETKKYIGSDLKLVGYRRASDGKLIGTTGYHSTDLIRVQGNDLTFFALSDSAAVNAISYFNNKGVFISGISNNQTIIAEQTVLKADIPADTHYVSICIDDARLTRAFIKVGGVLDIISKVESTINLNLDKKQPIKYGKNRFNKNTIIPNSILGDTNNVVSYSGFYISYPCYVGDLTTIHLNKDRSGGGYAFLDANGIFVNGGVVSGSTLICPTNAIWFRFSAPIATLNTMQVEGGSVATIYNEYTEYLDIQYRVEQSYEYAVDVVLPKKLFFVKNFDSYFYFENIIRKQLSEPFDLFFNNGIKFNRLSRFTFSSAVASGTLESNLIYKLHKFATKSFNYKVVDNALNSGKTINILPVGDSFTDIGSYLIELKRLLELAGITTNLIGTCGNSTFKAEGLSGSTIKSGFLLPEAGTGRLVTLSGVTELPSCNYPGVPYVDANGKQLIIRSSKIDGSGNGYAIVTQYNQADSYFSTMPENGTLTRTTSKTGVTTEGDAVINYTGAAFCYMNPFINPTTGLLDINNYLSTWGLTTPNIVLFQFTWNDLAEWATDSSIALVIDSFKTAVRHIHTNLPDANVILSIEPYGAISAVTSVSYNSNTNRDWHGKKFTVLRFIDQLIATFEDDLEFTPYVLLAPSYACVDLVNGYSNTTQAPNVYYSSTEITGGDGIHPKNGMLEIGAAIYPVVSEICTKL